ncbi:dipeptide transport system permease protein [Arboricoccus pini]|uniref:Dipeptide transport system permease protein n=1 Tax=Arboricoccus pini TaxID=1963835 RepID=A0A212QYB3_9PROT|nr:ABC transporter permease subunit [Arboricoccus pini]SNB64734.1 dipeptide transport system permease protein [Arboricoccus pini]
MLSFIVRRLAILVPTFLGVTFVAFILIRLVPGDPIEMMAGERGVDPARHAMLMTQYGLDRPLVVQYGIFLGHVLSGNLGQSVVTKQPVLTEFLSLFPATVELSLAAMLLAILVGLPAGILAAVKRGTPLDHLVMGASLTGYSMPIFWWALLLIIVFSGMLGWTPVSGRIDLLYYFDQPTGFMLIDSLLSDEPVDAFLSALSHLALPAIALATIPMAIIARQTRSAMLEVLSEDYVRTARAKGLSPLRVVGLHALRNALIPVITVIGLQLGTLFSGAILTETIFAWPGIGKWLIEAIGRRDYPAVQGGLLLIAVTVMLVNLAIDLLYGLVNPRIRHGG